MAKKNITMEIEDMLANFLEENNLELYDVEFVKEGRDRFLRVYIDKAWDPETKASQGYIGTEDCEIASRFLGEKLDEKDLIEENYYLEVSSPGMDRRLKKERDFIRYTGKSIDVKLYSGIDGKKVYEGILMDYENGDITLKDTDEKIRKFTKEQVAKVTLTVVF